MKLLFIVSSLWIGAVSTSAAFGLQPDMTISMRVLSPYGTDAKGNFQVPIHATAQNQGRDLAGRFKVSAEYRVSSGESGGAPIRYIGSPTSSYSGDAHYVWSRHAFSVSMSRDFSGVLTLPRSLAGRLVSLRVHVDSCAGEEFMPEYCRIDESREDNNTSRWVTVRF